MSTHNSPPQFKPKYDIIFAGGGSAACIAASRLAAADPDLSILLLDAGPHTHDQQNVDVPGLYPAQMMSPAVSFHLARSPAGTEGPYPVVSANCVGGGSNINFMMYARGSASDYDDWERVYHNIGWASADLLPLFKKIETYSIRPSEPTHGYTGPMIVSHGGFFTNVGREWLQIAPKYDQDRSTTEDPNDLSSQSINKWTRWPKWINHKTGRRSTVTNHYVYSETNTNLTVGAGCRVKRVIIENGRATGVEFVYDTKVYPESDSAVQSVYVNSLVVVAAGAVGSPAILERSGIGAKEILRAANIEQVVDLPVGNSYQDHHSVWPVFYAHESAETITFIVQSDEAKIAESSKEWTENATGPLATNGVDVGIKLRPTAQDLAKIGSDFSDYWKVFFEPAPDKPLVVLVIISGLVPLQQGLPRRQYFNVPYFLTYPLSHGHIHIKSDSVYDPQDIDVGVFKEPCDLAVMIWAYKKAREYARRNPFYQGEFAPTHPAFPEGSKAAIQENASPVDPSAPDIVYSEEDDAAIKQFLHSNAVSTSHSLGTCPMKPHDQGGVVDSALNVYGIQGLKVADMSIAPGNVGANTNSTALVIGEKAAVIIAQELGIKGV